jgi:hypothetical protein
LKSPGIAYQTELHEFLQEHPPNFCDYSNRELAHVSVHLRENHQKRTLCGKPEQPRRSFTAQDDSFNSAWQDLECFWQWLRVPYVPYCWVETVPVWDSHSCARGWPEQPKLHGRSSVGPVHGAAELSPRQALAAGQGTCGLSCAPVWDSHFCARDRLEQSKLHTRVSTRPVHGAAEVRPRQALAAGQGTWPVAWAETVN